MNILQAFAHDGFAGLEDQRTRPPTHSANQMTLPFLKEVLAIQQEYPRAGHFRVRGLLAKRTSAEPPSEATISRAMAINRQHHGAPGPWVSAKPTVVDDVVKEFPFAPAYRHRYWFIDVRYLVRIGDDEHWTYSITVIEGYSRKILAGMASAYQDSIAVLQLLAPALTEYGKPEGLVSDNGGIFTSAAYTTLLEALDIDIGYIEKDKPWENLIEAQFLGQPFASWTLDRLAVYLNEERGIPIKRRRIDELLIAEGLRWRTQEGWFGERAAARSASCSEK